MAGSETSLLERVIVAHRCRSMHHYIVMDALNRMDGDAATGWKDVFLFHSHELLKGAKAPDAEFKDFKNHVLHVGEGEWGGARDAATEWYARSVEALRAKKWSKAAYALGVMSHYYADPCQPFHTGQTEEEGAIHRAVEWSIVKSRPALKARIDGQGYPDVPAGDGPGFVADMVLAGAKTAHPHYQTFIDHYDLSAGMDNPPDGLDETMFNAAADMIAYATSGVAQLFSRAVAEAGVAAPKVHLSLPGYLAALDVPVRKIAKVLGDARDRHQIQTMYAELQKTGKVIKTLPDDDKAIRKLHARDVLRKPLKALDVQPLKPLGEKHVPWARPQADAAAAPAAAKSDSAKPSRADRKAAKRAEADRKAAERAKAKADADAAKQKAAEDKAAAAEAKRAEANAAKQKAAEEKAAAEASRAAAAKAKRDAEIEAKAAEDARLQAEREAETAATEAAIAAAEAAEYEDPDLLEHDEEVDTDEDEAALASGDDFEVEIEDEAVDMIAPEAMAETPEEAAAEDDEDDEDGRSGLTLDSPIVEAPSIGRKTAKRLARAGLHTVGDLLLADVEETAAIVDASYIDAETLADWQDQTQLMMDVPGLRVHDVQVLVGAGMRSAEDLAQASVRDVFLMAMEFLATPEGERVARDDDDLLVEDEVEQWIDLAQAQVA